MERRVSMIFEKYWTESGRGDGQGDVEKKDHQLYRRPYMMGKARGKEDVFSYYNSKLNAFASFITGILSKIAALLFATMNKTTSVLSTSGIKLMYTHVFQLEMSLTEQSVCFKSV